MSADGPRSGDRLLPILLIVGGVSFVGATLLGIFGDELSTLESPGANSYSESALGHSAFVELLTRRGYDIVRSRSRSGAKSGDGLLVLAEPQLSRLVVQPDQDSDETADDRVSRTLAEASHILLTLPKWTSEPDPGGRHIESAKLQRVSEANRVLDQLGIEVAVYRPNSVEEWSEATGERVNIALDSPQLLTPGTAHAVIAIVDSERGILLAEVRPTQHAFVGARVFILSDPDVMANHTLSGGNDHAWLLTKFIEEFGFAHRPIVFDEVLHGFGYQRSFWRQLFDYPFVLVTMQLIGVAIVLTWASLGRFGSPQRVTTGHAAGWRPLIVNTADLLRHGQYYGHAIGRYFREAVRDVESRTRPRHLDGKAAERWLQDLSKRRAPDIDLDELRENVESLANERKREHAVVGVARRIHLWKQEMLNAPR